MIIKNLDLRNLYMIYKFLTNLDEETKRHFHPPLVYSLHKNPFSLINYLRLFISTIVPRHILIKILPRLACITVTAKSNHIQGFAQLNIRRSLTECYESELGIVVRKEFRAKGIGSMLLNTLIGEAIRTNVTKITLIVMKDNVPAINLYRKHGFKIIKETVDLYDGKVLDSLLMESCLTVLN